MCIRDRIWCVLLGKKGYTDYLNATVRYYTPQNLKTHLFLNKLNTINSTDLLEFIVNRGPVRNFLISLVMIKLIDFEILFTF